MGIYVSAEHFHESSNCEFRCHAIVEDYKENY